MEGPRKWLAGRFEGQGRKTIGWAFAIAALLLFSLGIPGRTGLSVIGTLPADGSTDVPVSSGIEITFSGADLGNPLSYFSIEPSVSGRFETHKNTLVFIPSQLRPAATYRVSVSKGFGVQLIGPGLADDFSMSFTTAAIRQATPPGIILPDGPFEFPTKDPPVIEVDSTSEIEGANVATAVYRYTDATRYLAAVRDPGRGDGAITELPKIATFSTKIQKLLPHGNYLMFPEPLPAGYYVAAVEETSPAAVGQQVVRFQVTDISYYVSVTRTKTLIWLNDLAAGGPVRGAHIRIGNTVIETDPTGVAVIPTSPLAGAPSGVVGIEGVGSAADGREVAIRVTSTMSASLNDPLRPDLYWRYIYVDRPVYGPSDTVNFWGLIKPREIDARRIERLTVQLSGPNDYSSGPAHSDLARTDVAVSNGFFSGSVALPDLRPGGYSLSATVGGVSLVNSSISVETYTKPPYTLDLRPDRRAVFAGEDVSFSARARFFDGTPVIGLPLRVQNAPGVNSLTTDTNGEATFHVRAGARNLFVSITAARAELGEIDASASVDVFQSAVDVEWSSSVAGGIAEVRLRAREVTLDRINAGERPDRCCLSDLSVGSPLDGQSITGTLEREYETRTETGELYDYISKQVLKQYNYESKYVVVDNFRVTTDSLGDATYRFAALPDTYYRLSFRSVDSQGRASESFGHEYGVRAQASTPTREIEGTLVLLGKNSWRTGQVVEAEYDLGNSPAPARSNAFLFYALRLGLGVFQVQSEPVFRLPFREEDIPNTSLTAVFFDGRRYSAAHQRIDYDASERALSLKITADKAEYRPGDTVRLTVRATDSAQRPTAATVNLNVVDEALYAVSSENVDLVGDLYTGYSARVPADELVTRFSHYHVLFSCRCGATGGGGVGLPREVFQDAVIFRTIVTDADGNAMVSFQLPDNLTTWRLTYQAFTAKLEATSGTVALAAKLPFFVNLLASDSYRVGDAPAIVARTYGDKLKVGDDVTISAELAGPASLTTKVSARAFEAKAIALPTLAAGDYTLTVSASGPDGLIDAVRRTIHVQPSFLRREAVDFQLVSAGTRVAGATSGLTTVEFADYDRATLLAALWRMRWEWGGRVEQELARSLGAQWLRDLNGQGPATSVGFDLGRYEVPKESGAIAILPYGSADLELSAKIADLMPNQVDPAVAKYFVDRLAAERTAVSSGDTGARRRTIAALYGLAALGRADPDAIEAFAERSDLTVMERLYLGQALALSGDESGARRLLNSVLASAELVGADLRILAGPESDDLLSATALAASLAARLGQPDAGPLLRYASANRPSETLTFVEQLLAIRALSAQLPQGGTAVTYILGGVEETKEIAPAEVFTLDLLPQELATLSFRSTRGRVGLTLMYDAPLRLDASETKSGFGVTRTYAWRGDLLAITLHPTFPATAPAGAYEIVDVLPAGIEAVSRPWVYSQARDANLASPMQVEGRRLIFYAYPGMPDIVYFGRAVNGGTFSAEPAVLEHMQSGGVWAWSAPLSLQIICLGAIELCAAPLPIVPDLDLQAPQLVAIYILLFALIIVIVSVARKTPVRNGFAAVGWSHWILLVALIVAGLDEITVAHDSVALFVLVGAALTWEKASRRGYKLDRQSWLGLTLPLVGPFFVLWRRGNRIWKDPTLAAMVPASHAIAGGRPSGAPVPWFARRDRIALLGIAWLFVLTQLLSGLLTNPPQLVFGLVLVVALVRRRIRPFNSSRPVNRILGWLGLIAIALFALLAAVSNGPCGGLVGC